MVERYVSVKELAARHGTSVATVWRRVKDDPSFPRAHKFSPGCTRFKLSEVTAWEKSRAEDE